VALALVVFGAYDSYPIVKHIALNLVFVIFDSFSPFFVDFDYVKILRIHRIPHLQLHKFCVQLLFTIVKLL